MVASYGIFAVFNSEIVNWSSGFQSDYKIDAYYYLYLGREAGRLADSFGGSLYEAADSLRPNAASDGVVYMSAVLLNVAQFYVLVPFVLSCCVLLTVWLLYKNRLINDAALLLPFSGLFPYMQGPSKEVFFLMGLLLLLYGVLKPGRWLLGLVGLTLMYLARREAFYMFGASLMIWFVAKSRVALVLTGMVAFLVYAAVGRESAFAAATLTQVLSESADVGFCNVGPLNVCVTDVGGMEIVFVARLTSLLLLPVKWIVDGLQVFTTSGLPLSEMLIRWANVLHLIWLFVVFRLSAPVGGTERIMRQILTLFGAIYWLAYATVLYFQPSRQAVLASTIAGLGLLIHSRVKEQGRPFMASCRGRRKSLTTPSLPP